MRRRRLIERLPQRLRGAFCLLLIGHSYHFKLDGARMFLACEVCGYESQGTELEAPRRRRELPGDARRFESYARRLGA